VFDQIQAEIQTSECVPAGGSSWTDQIDAAHTPVFQPPFALPSDTFGYVYLYDQQGNPLPAGQHQLPITHDLTTGKLSFRLSADQGLAPGVYQLRAFAGYKGEDSVSRVYNWITGTNAQSQTFQIASTGTPGQVALIPSLDLDLPPTVSVCP
jgi:hypothetical protein